MKEVREYSAKKTDADIQSIVKAACTEAIDFIDSEISETRNKAQRYYEGQVDIGWEDGTSKVVSTKVRDTIRVILPNLMRIFLASDKPVEFVPQQPDQVQQTEQATEYICREFERLGGYSLLYQAMHDAVVKKAGFIKCYWKDYEDAKVKEVHNVTDEELVQILEAPGVEITGSSTEEREGVDYHTLKLTITSEYGEICLEVIPPEDFFIDDSATTFDDAVVYGHQCTMRVCDLVDMGFKYEDVYSLGLISEDDTTEKYERADYSHDQDGNFTQDPSQKPVTVTECYMQIDLEGNGNAKRHKFLCGGQEYKILDQEEWSGHCIHKFEADPIPHLFFGNSYPELLFEDQDAGTAMLRGVLNNIAMTNIPRTEVNDDMVNMDDMLNNEIGGIVRSKAIGSINPLLVPFIAGDVLPAMQYYDMQVEAKAGVNNLSTGLNPDLLQGTSATAVNAVTAASSNQLEAIARHIAQGGMCSLFRNMLELTIDNVADEVFMRQEGNEFVPMMPSSWSPDYDMTINVGLGTGQDNQKLAVLAQVIQLQSQAAMSGQTAVGPNHIRNSVADVLAIAGVHNVDRYWPVTPEQEPQPPQPDPMMVAAQAEATKAQADLVEAQTKQAQVQGEIQIKQHEAETRRMEAETKRMEAAVAAQKVGADIKGIAAKAAKDLADAEGKDIENAATESGINRLVEQVSG